MKALVLLSGGVDSSTCLALAKEKYGDEVLALSMSYGQKHSREVQSAQAIAAYYKVQLLEMEALFVLLIFVIVPIFVTLSKVRDLFLLKRLPTKLQLTSSISASTFMRVTATILLSNLMLLGLKSRSSWKYAENILQLFLSS